MPSYEAFDTDVLVKEIRNGNQKAFFELSSRFGGIIKDIANITDVCESEREDLYQEGLIGLYKAAITYDASMNATFNTYATVCIKHSIYSSLRIYFSKKNRLVRTSCSFDEVLTEQCPDSRTEPEKLFIEKESIRLIKESVDSTLSSYEREVFKLFLKGLSYEAIARLLSTTPKSVDNAIQRIRGKLKKIIRDS